MDVSGVGAAGPSGSQFSTALRVLEAPKGQSLASPESVVPSGDTITATLRQLSDLAALGFLELIERPPSPENARRLEDLLRASISKAAEGNMQEALVKLAEFAELDPRRAETLKSEPGLACLRPEVSQLLFRLASAAHLNAETQLGQAIHLLDASGPNDSQRSEPGLAPALPEGGQSPFRKGSVLGLDAESRLGVATHVLEAAGLRESLGQEFRLQTAVLLAGRLLEAGGYANFMCSAALSQMAIIQFGLAPSRLPSDWHPRSAPMPSATADFDLRRKWLPRIKKLWLRAPLLVLLLAWLALGFLAGSVSAILRTYWPEMGLEPSVSWGFEVWGIGFLALVGFGFYAKVRDWRR